MPTACPTRNKLPDRLKLGVVTRCDRFGDEAEGKAVSLPLGTEVWGRGGAVLMRLLRGSWERIVSIVLRTNCCRVILWEEEMSTMCRSVLRRKMEYEIAWTTSV
jgi:hypothetical protein